MLDKQEVRKLSVEYAYMTRQSFFSYLYAALEHSPEGLGVLLPPPIITQHHALLGLLQIDTCIGDKLSKSCTKHHVETRLILEIWIKSTQFWMDNLFCSLNNSFMSLNKSVQEVGILSDPPPLLALRGKCFCFFKWAFPYSYLGYFHIFINK